MKKRGLWRFLLIAVVALMFPWGQTVTQGADYTNARAFYYSTGLKSGKHIDVVNSTIYFATKGRLAHTYSVDYHTYYDTVGFDVELSAAGETLIFSVKTGVSLEKVPGAQVLHDEGDGTYSYVLYHITADNLEKLAKNVNKEKAEKIFKADEIFVRMDSIVIRKYAGMRGDIEEDGKGGLNIYRPNNDYEWVWRIKDEAQLRDVESVYGGHVFEEDRKLTAKLENFKLDIYYGVDGTPEKSTAGSTHVTVGKGFRTATAPINGERIPYTLCENNKVHIESDRIANSMTLFKPDTADMKKTGYHLDEGEEWITADDRIFAAGKSYRPTFILPECGYADSSICLYANWKPNTYEIIYDPNGGDGTMGNTKKYFDDEEFSLKENKYTRTGYFFAGWALSENGPVVYTDKQGGLKNLTAENEGKIRLFAVWSSGICSITLDSDGAEVKGTEEYFQKYGDGNYKEKECETSISAITKPERTGYDFGGYYTGKNGTGIQQVTETGQIISTKTTFTTDTTLYAKWTAHNYTIKYHPNGGTGYMADTSATYGKKELLRVNTFERTGYTFAGWAENAVGVKKYDNVASVENLTAVDEGVVNLFAVWVPNVYTITLDNQGATTAGTDKYYQKYNVGLFKEKACGTSITAVVVPTKFGYTFDGYWTGRNGTGTQYVTAAGQITATNTTFVKDITLYANWKINTYTIRYHENGGSGTMADTPATYNKSVLLRVNAFERTGYTFKGWALSSTGSIVHQNNVQVKNLTTENNKVVTLYAVWEPVRSMITLDPQGGTGGTGFFYAKYGVNFYTNELFTTLISQITVPAKPGHDFKGYYKDIAGNGSTLIGANGIISAAKDAFVQETTLFAKWQAKSYTVTFDKQGGTNGSDSVTATYKKRMPAAEAPTRAGFTFKGYYAQKNGAGTKYYDEFMNSDVIYESTQNTTLYAYWVDDTAPTVILKANVDEANPWTNQPVSLNAIAEDLGTGLSSVYIYQIGDNDSLSCVASATGLNGAKSKELTFTNTKEGVVRYKAVATDMTGKTSESYNTVFYDKTAPTGDVGVSVSGNTFYFNIIITDINPGN